MFCSRCGAERTTRALFCACGKVFSAEELRAVHLTGPAGMSPRVERFWETGDPTYLDSKVPVAAVDRANADLPRHIGGDA